MSASSTHGEVPAALVLPPRMDTDDIAALRTRLQRLREGLSPYAVERLRMHVIGADDRSALVVDDDGRAAWNAKGAGLAMRAWESGHDGIIDEVSACAAADPHFDLDDPARFSRRYVRLPASGAHEDAVLELRLSSAAGPAHLGDLARALWYMQGAEDEKPVRRDMAAMYRAQALASVDGGEGAESLTVMRPMLGRRALLASALALLCLPLALLIPMSASISGQGRVAIANAPAQVIDRSGGVVALEVAQGQRVEAGQALFWVEDPDAQRAAEAAYLRFADEARERLLDPRTVAESQLPDRLAELRVSANARRVPVLAATAGIVRELPRVGEVFERGARIGFVMPDRPVFELDATIDAISSDALRIGDAGRVRVADGREWAVRVTWIGARAESAASGGAGADGVGNEGSARSRLGIRAMFLGSDGLLPEMPVEAQFDGRTMPLYRQLLKRWGRSG